MTRLSDEEICTLGRNRYQALGMDEELLFKRGYRHRENELIPQIEKLQGENESMRKDLVEQMQKSSDYFAEKLTLNTELQQLTAKHERLVKGLHDLKHFHATIMETDGQSATFNTAEVITVSQLIDVLTESEDK